MEGLLGCLKHDMTSWDKRTFRRVVRLNAWSNRTKCSFGCIQAAYVYNMKPAIGD